MPDPVLANRPDIKLYPTRFLVEYHDRLKSGGRGPLVGRVPASNLWIYTDVPGDGVFKLDTRWKLDEDGKGGKLLPEAEYNFYFSYPDEKLEKGDLEGKITEADCQKVKTPGASGNLIEVTLEAPVVKVPLGKDYKTKVEKGAAAKIYVPSRRGGKLTIAFTNDAAEMRVFFPDLKTPFSEQKRTEKLVHHGAGEEMKGKKEISAFIKPGKFKWFYVLVTAAGEMTATFYEEAIPREKDRSPMFPYHFYYWPVNQREPWDGTNAVLRRYAKAFGKNEDEVVWWEIGGAEAVADGKAHGHDEVVKRANDKVYEEKDKGHFRPSQPGWAGHCHNAAPASIFFKEPPSAGKDHGGVHFTQGELEFLQTEFTGNYGTLDGNDGFGLEGYPLTVVIKIRWKWDTQTGESPEQENLLKFLKPSDTNPAGSLEDALYDRFHHQSMYQGKSYEQFDRQNAKDEVQRIVAAHGGESAFNQKVQETWGRVGVEFLQNVYTLLGDRGNPSLGDIRSNQASAGPSAIWNNVAMYGRTHLAQKAGSDSELEVEAQADVYFNIDNAGMIGAETCALEDREVVPKNYWGREMKLALTYKATGDPDLAAASQFTSLQFLFGGSLQGEIYMPTYLATVHVPVSHSRYGRDDFGGGNPHIDYSALDAKVVQLRDKFA